MVTPSIQEFADQIAAKFSPERVILFGSHAKGLAGPDSDVDILVVLSHDGRNAKKAAEILSELDPTFEIDLLVRTPADLETRLRLGDDFMIDILNEGVKLYDSQT
jgi:predicted nucleotidyltransferase